MYVPLAFQCVYGCSDDRNENEDEKDGSKILAKVEKWELLGFLYADYLALCI